MMMSSNTSIATIQSVSSSISNGDAAGHSKSVTQFSRELHTSIGSNSISPMIFDCLGTLSKLERLPDYHDLHLSRGVVRVASELIAHLARNYQIEAPKVLPENDECVALTWEFAGMKRYLAIYEDAVDLTLQNTALGVSCHEYLCDDYEFDFDAVGKAVSISGEPRSVTSI